LRIYIVNPYRIILIVFLAITLQSVAQEDFVPRNPQSGYFSVTQRTSLSMWSLNQWKLNGLGKGTAFRVQFSRRLNSEWYGDFIKTHYEGKVFRSDRHLTNSMMYYFRKLDTFKHKFHPFISASVFCLDITNVQIVGGESMGRFSFSQQFGAGTHFFVTERFDLSIYAQYYNHLGNDIHVDEHDDGSLGLHEEKHRISLEGHMFLVFSVGYRMCDLWGRRKVQL